MVEAEARAWTVEDDRSKPRAAYAAVACDLLGAAKGKDEDVALQREAYTNKKKGSRRGDLVQRGSDV